MIDPILPPATIGILGSGQLGRYLAIAARRFGYRVHVFSPGRDTPAGQVAEREFSAAYDDLAAVRAFAQGVDVVTYEFENVPAAAAAAVDEIVPLRPGVAALHTAQDRRREKGFFRAQGLPTAPFAIVENAAQLPAALEAVGLPAVLKMATSGYDGRGQWRIHTAAEARHAYHAAGERPSIVETLVPFEQEISVIAGRGLDGVFAAYDVIANDHQNHILDVSVTPADVPPTLAAAAIAHTRHLMDALDVVGVLCVEFFVVPGAALLLNEFAPRPHNSGHLTLDAAVTDQFEQQLRAICGLPLGGTTWRQPAALANLLGDLWAAGTPDWTAVLDLPDVHLHLYGKGDARPGRKMGHLTALASTPDEAVRRVRHARNLLATATAGHPSSVMEEEQYVLSDG